MLVFRCSKTKEDTQIPCCPAHMDPEPVDATLGSPAWYPLWVKQVASFLALLFEYLIHSHRSRKSTVIKLVIDLHSQNAKDQATPVVGATGHDVPTSGDVHLYPHPQTFESDMPILYAYCEGLEGGERERIATRFKKKEKRSRIGRVDSFEKKMAKIPYISEREITWANTNTKRSREFAVTHLYPRLLYTFSDVVVFVLKNPRWVDLGSSPSVVAVALNLLMGAGSSRACSRN